jgi:mevalonate kinase
MSSHIEKIINKSNGYFIYTKYITEPSTLVITMGYGSGFGKVILFNEHFVVYGIPAIASAIDKSTIAIVDAIDGSSGVNIDDRRPATPGYKEEKLSAQRESILRILAAMKLDITNVGLNIHLGGDLVATSGIGASAASCTAIARAIADQFRIPVTDAQINEFAYEGEKAYHGTPSGIDNTVATYGGLIWFKKIKGATGSQNVIETIRIQKPIEIVMADTGLVGDTKRAVASVRERKTRYPERYATIFRDAETLVHRARIALENFALDDVGTLMNENHKLLQALGVSCPELDELVELARELGALGAKLTGGGLGGSIVALTPGAKLQHEVAEGIERKGYRTLKTKIGTMYQHKK